MLLFCPAHLPSLSQSTALSYTTAGLNNDLLIDGIKIKQDNVLTNTESVQCISVVYSICLYKYYQ